MRSGSNESVSSAPAPAKGAKKDKGVVTGSLRINMAGLAGDKQEVDIPYIEDTSSTKPKVTRESVIKCGLINYYHFSTQVRGLCCAGCLRIVTARCCLVRSICLT